MFQRILMPVDLSERHGPALAVAVELCRQWQGEVTLLHIVELIAGLGVEEERPFYDRLERVARAHLQRLGRRLDEGQARWRIDVRLGHRAQQVVQAARETDADLIVLTSPPPDPENPLSGWSSLSFRVSLAAPCPVLLVRADRPAPPRPSE
jgi:nucleotide-binding universal stress UspA family protein